MARSAGTVGRWIALPPVLAAVTFMFRLALAWRFPGYLTGDDLEIVQMAARYAAGVSYQPWVLRCLFEPLVFVWPVMKTAVLAGARDPAVLSWTAAIPSALASSLSILLVASLARRCGFSPATAAIASFLYAVHWLPLAYGATPFPRPISTALLLGAFVLVSSPSVRPRAAFAAGALAGAAFAVRWSEGVALIPLLGWTIWRSRSRNHAIVLLAGFSAGAFLCAGITDWVTWGAPFRSLVQFFRIMYLEIPASRLAQEDPFYQYLWDVFHWAGPVAVALLFPAWKDRRSRAPLAVLGVTVLALSAFAHKEWRYLQFAIPFLCLSAAAGWQHLRERRRGVLATLALVLSAAFGLERTWTLLRNKSQAEIAAARYIRSLSPRPRAIAFEQMWAYGEHLWLGNEVRLTEIEYGHPLRPRAIRDAATGADLVGVYARHLDELGRAELAAGGFREIARFRRDLSYECVLFAGRGFVPRSRTGNAAGGAASGAPASHCSAE